MDRRFHQIGGILLMSGGLAATVGAVLTPPQPALLSRLAEMGSGGGVYLSATGVGGCLLLVSTLFLSRHFAGAKGETWAFLGNASLLVGSLVLVGISLLGMPQLIGSLATSGVAAGVTVGFLDDSMPEVVAVLFPLAVASFGLSLLQNETWPRWLGWFGVLIGIGSAAVAVSGASLGAASAVPLALTYVWLGAAGSRFRGMRLSRVPVPAFELPGETLRDRLEQGKRLSVEDALGIARRMALALEAPHRSDEGEAPAELPALEIQQSSDPVHFEFAAEAADSETGTRIRHDEPLVAHAAQGEVRSDVFREWLSDPNFVRH